ncbi:lysophospholipid acyltransferase family protein [Chlamydiales bacterium]|nr:lysophospholipid acyltransferase family protein [Chlamydiales bacterium]
MKYRLVGFLARSFLSLLMLTCRTRLYGIDHFVETAKKGSLILTFWHNRIALVPHTFLPYTSYSKIFIALISKSRDGNWLDAIVRGYSPSRTLRVSHKNRHGALSQVIKELNKEGVTMMVTPDGPRGPIYKMKEGPLKAAKETGAPLVSFNWEATSFWEISSWDKFRIPKPFSTIKLHVAPPIYLDKTSSLEDDREKVEKSMHLMID